MSKEEVSKIESMGTVENNLPVIPSHLESMESVIESHRKNKRNKSQFTSKEETVSIDNRQNSIPHIKEIFTEHQTSAEAGHFVGQEPQTPLYEEDATLSKRSDKIKLSNRKVSEFIKNMET